MDPVAQARIEATAALRKALGLEQLLGRLRSPADPPDAPVARLRRRPPGPPADAKAPTSTAA